MHRVWRDDERRKGLIRCAYCEIQCTHDSFKCACCWWSIKGRLFNTSQYTSPLPTVDAVAHEREKGTKDSERMYFQLITIDLVLSNTHCQGQDREEQTRPILETSLAVDWLLSNFQNQCWRDNQYWYNRQVVIQERMITVNFYALDHGHLWSGVTCSKEIDFIVLLIRDHSTTIDLSGILANTYSNILLYSALINWISDSSLRQGCLKRGQNDAFDHNHWRFLFSLSR